jgi:hypothetical protein
MLKYRELVAEAEKLAAKAVGKYDERVKTKRRLEQSLVKLRVRA